MFVVGNLISALAGVLYTFLHIYTWVVIIAALITWVNPDPYNPVVRFLYSVTEPVFSRVRSVLGRFIPLHTMGIDFSPLIVLLILLFLQQFLPQTLYEIAASFR
ncbi:MAG: YggT family protein [Desulfomonile tiedjei]|nr:YggT family protein [Desulfomonile tiedjei]